MQVGEEDLNKHEELTFCVISLSSMTVNILEVDIIVLMWQW